MQLTKEEKEMLEGKHGKATKKAMEILVALGEIYGAEKLIDVKSVQIAGVSYANLGEPGLEFIETMAKDGKVKVLTTLNPAGMDLEDWESLEIPDKFARNQLRVINAFKKMGVITTATCTPYLVGNLPLFGDHIAWSESSAVCFSNSVIGARSNREGGPSALAAALTGKTPAYGLHLDENRKPQVTVLYDGPALQNALEFGAFGKVVGEKTRGKISYIRGIKAAFLEELKSFCASIATYGGTALAHFENITPEAKQYTPPQDEVHVTREEIDKAIEEMNDQDVEVDFVSIGCPHASIREVEKIAKLIKGKKVKKEMWITTSREVKEMARRMGFVEIIESAGAKIAADTCCVVAPIKGRFKGLATNSSKACYYGRGRNNFKVKLLTLEECVMEALKE